MPEGGKGECSGGELGEEGVVYTDVRLDGPRGIRVYSCQMGTMRGWERR